MSEAPVGVFDSGVGGVSVLQELRRALPAERLLYVADSGHCPYGGRPQEEITARAAAISEFLLGRGAKLIVVACNTATIAAVETLRAEYPISFVGMEPAVKPAVATTRSGVVGVLATGASLAGEKFHRLVERHASGVRVLTQPCPGLVELVEEGDLDGPRTEELVRRFTAPLLAAGADTLVLGCTHYAFLRPLLAQAAGPDVALVDTGEAVARRTADLLARDGLEADGGRGRVEWFSSGAGGEAVLARLWGAPVAVQPLPASG